MSWVEAVEHAYVEMAVGRPVVRASESELAGAPRSKHARASAALGAIASRYLAVGTPRTIGLIVDPARVGDGALSLEAHRTWFAPREVRCAVVDFGGALVDHQRAIHGGAGSVDDGGGSLAKLAARVGGAVTSLAEALASDIVCVHVPLSLTAAQLRRGTHLNLLAGGTLDNELQRIAAITDEEPGLGALCAGLVDGRQLDEITVFVIGSAAVALAALDRE